MLSQATSTSNRQASFRCSSKTCGPRVRAIHRAILGPEALQAACRPNGFLQRLNARICSSGAHLSEGGKAPKAQTLKRKGITKAQARDGTGPGGPDAQPPRF